MDEMDAQGSTWIASDPDPGVFAAFFDALVPGPAAAPPCAVPRHPVSRCRPLARATPLTPPHPRLARPAATTPRPSGCSRRAQLAAIGGERGHSAGALQLFPQLGHYEAEYSGAAGRRRGRTASSLFRRQATLGQQYAALLPLLLAAGDPLKQGLDRHAPRQSAAIRGDLWEDCQPLLRAAATVAAVRVELIKLYGRLAQLATTDAPAAV